MKLADKKKEMARRIGKVKGGGYTTFIGKKGGRPFESKEKKK